MEDQRTEAHRARRVWWVNQSQSFDIEREAGVIWAGYDVEDAARARVDEIRAGDLIVHNSQSHVRAISRALSDPERAEVEGHDGPGRTVRVAYWDFDEQPHFMAFARDVLALDLPEGGVFDLRKTGKPHPKQGYCFPFSHEALSILRPLAGPWPPWADPERLRRFPTSPQYAVDTEEPDASTVASSSGTDAAAPERRTREVTRIVRDSALARRVKEASGYRCQLCGAEPIELPKGTYYAEAHHLHPLGQDGPDVEANMVRVCPACHVKLDYGVVTVTHETLARHSASPVGEAFVAYHNREIAASAAG